MNKNDSCSEKKNVYTMDQVIFMMEMDTVETFWDIVRDYGGILSFITFIGSITALDFLLRRKKLLKRLEEIP